LVAVYLTTVQRQSVIMLDVETDAQRVLNVTRWAKQRRLRQLHLT